MPVRKWNGRPTCNSSRTEWFLSASFAGDHGRGRFFDADEGDADDAN
jgi:hypothetical protein